MPANLHVVLEHWVKWAAPLTILAVTLAVGYAAKRATVGALQRWSKRTTSPAPAAILHSLEGTFMLWVLILGTALAMDAANLTGDVWWHRWLSGGMLVLSIGSATWVGMRLAGNLIKLYGHGVAEVLPVTTLTQTLVQIAIAILGVIVLLNYFGRSITPILTALGVGGLAVALALQDTLGNLFAGFYIAVAGQIRVGDYIRLNTGEEGYVTDITWRTTAIRALANNMIMIPNSKLAQAIVTNFHLPEKRMSLVLNVGVSYDEDPDRIEQVMLEEARGAAGQVPGLLAEPAPAARFIPGFGDSSLNFSLIVQVAEFVDQFAVQSELRKRLLRRFRQEGIRIPYPTRTVHVQERGASSGQ
jgi:small-conductance mechanosensitive channel